ncbi:MAG: hypothetical protein CMJ64_09485 [Planctomycetaceae bacterium]|nr:hypothetical protein [Planctomycetaceae bacterium]
MKAERRHELQDNELANWLGQYLAHVKPYSKTILAVALLALAAAVAGSFVLRDQAARAQLGWNDFYQAFGQRNTDSLEDVAKQYAGTDAAIWATQAEADLQLAEGVNALYRSREQARDLLESAKNGYSSVAVAPGTDRLLKERAWFGLGRVHESLSELDEAIDYYGRLAQSSPDSALGKEAQRRLDMLKDPDVEKWYNWFARQKPRPPIAPGIPGGPGMPDLPTDLGNLPDRPDLSLPTPLETSVPIGPAEAPLLPPEGSESAAPAPPKDGSDEPPAESAPAKSDPDAKPASEPASSEPEKPAATDPPSEGESTSGESGSDASDAADEAANSE